MKFEDIRTLLGKQVVVTLSDKYDERHPVISRGVLVGFGEGGDFEILEDDGFVHYCWPLLEIRERDESEQEGN